MVDSRHYEEPSRLTMNERNWEHHASNGTVSIASRCDFAEGMTLLVPEDIGRERAIKDIMEITAYHATQILPKLAGGFRGYSSIKIKIEQR